MREVAVFIQGGNHRPGGYRRLFFAAPSALARRPRLRFSRTARPAACQWCSSCSASPCSWASLFTSGGRRRLRFCWCRSRGCDHACMCRAGRVLPHPRHLVPINLSRHPGSSGKPATSLQVDASMPGAHLNQLQLARGRPVRHEETCHLHGSWASRPAAQAQRRNRFRLA